MTLNRTNIVLSVLLAVVFAMSLATHVDYSQPNVEILPDMKYTPAWTAYSSNSVFANERTLQAPPRGTIARGQLPLHFDATKEDAIRAGEEIVNPYSTDSSDDSAADWQASIVRGNEAYRVFCTCCHGATGAGDGPVTTRGFPPPPSLRTGKSREMKDGQLFHVLTYGQASMPDFRSQLSSDRRWDLVNYIRSLQPNTPDGTSADATTTIESSESDASSTANEPPKVE